MIELTDTEWESLFDKVDDTIAKVISELPPEVKTKADEILCYIDKYHPDTNSEKNTVILGLYMPWTKGPIFIYAGQIHEHCNKNIDDTLQSVRHVYLHELAHAVGDLKEYEVKALGL